MKNGISQIGFWIMTSCVRHLEPVIALGTEDEEQSWIWFGKRRPTQDRELIAHELHSLFLKGDLRAERSEWRSECIGSEFCPTIEEIWAEFEDKSKQPRLSYFLTPQGGARWEAAANADWSKFVEVRELSFDWPRIRTYYRATSANHFAIGQDLREERFHGKALQYEIARWCIIRDWQATYWKTLPLVCRLSGILMCVAPEPQFPLTWSRKRFEWYTDPWAESSAYPRIAVPDPGQPIPKVPPTSWGIVGPEWQWNESLFEE